MAALYATARFFPEGSSQLPNPYLEMMIGDPAAGEVYRCVLELDGAEAIEPGASGPARGSLVSGLLPDWPEPWPLWHGHVIGELTGLSAEDPTARSPHA